MIKSQGFGTDYLFNKSHEVKILQMVEWEFLRGMSYLGRILSVKSFILTFMMGIYNGDTHLSCLPDSAGLLALPPSCW